MRLRTCVFPPPLAPPRQQLEQAAITHFLGGGKPSAAGYLAGCWSVR